MNQNMGEGSLLHHGVLHSNLFPQQPGSAVTAGSRAFRMLWILNFQSVLDTLSVLKEPPGNRR